MPCASCERADIPSPEELESIARELSLRDSNQLSHEDRALRERRLKACRTCESLSFGVLCSWCGCFVQIRSIHSANTCPDPSGSRWI
ncbi:MAG TPA: DUF6171 family protein [Treponemataceae bacterium]|nr:DUF6171 family protein [Treponemataceae bacterium]